jgi:hypothetical protein
MAARASSWDISVVGKKTQENKQKISGTKKQTAT